MSQKTSGFAGSIYSQPKKAITNINQLRKADHVVFQRNSSSFGYEHHGIVVDVNVSDGTFTVIEFRKIPNSYSKPKVKKYTHRYGDDTKDIFIVLYSEEDCLPDKMVIETAYDCLENWKSYNLIWKNCECMATYCKTGKERTEQVRHIFLRGGCKLATHTLPSAAAKVLVKKTAKTGIKKYGIPIIGSGALVESGLALYDIRHALKQKKNGQLGNKRTDAVINTRVATLVGDIALGTVGMYVGGFLGGPVGAGIGSLAGSIIGNVGGQMSGSAIFDQDHFDDDF